MRFFTVLNRMDREMDENISIHKPKRNKKNSIILEIYDIAPRDKKNDE